MFLFSLQGTEKVFGTQSKIYGGFFFAKKCWELKVFNYFYKKSSTLDFWFLNAALGNIIKKKNSHLKDISPALLKTFCVIIHIMHILFCGTNQKNVLQTEIKWWTFVVYLLTFEVYLLIGEPSSLLPLNEWLKMICVRSYVGFLNFLSNGEGLDCFSNGLTSCVKSVK